MLLVLGGGGGEYEEYELGWVWDMQGQNGQYDQDQNEGHRCPQPSMHVILVNMKSFYLYVPLCLGNCGESAFLLAHVSVRDDIRLLWLKFFIGLLPMLKVFQGLVCYVHHLPSNTCGTAPAVRQLVSKHFLEVSYLDISLKNV